MSNDHKKGPGGHYSGANPIPNIQKFIQNLDSEKSQRDARINEQQQLQQQNHQDVDHGKDPEKGQPHGVSGTRKTVTDPTTGKDVEIEDVNADFMKSVEDPQVCQLSPNTFERVLNMEITALSSKCESQ
jgi:hypothetical protein